MIEIKINLIPYGDRSQTREIATATIANDGTSKSTRIGHYVAGFATARERATAHLSFHDRRRNVWSLLYECLKLVEEAEAWKRSGRSSY